MGRVNRSPLRSLLAGGTTMLALACTELPPAPVTPPAVRLELHGCETVPACRTCTLGLVAFDANRNETLPPNVTWSSNGPFATVDQGGKVTGVSPGGVEIRAVAREDPMLFAEKNVSILPGSPACGT